MHCETEKISDICLQEAIAEEAERRRLSRKPFLRRATITFADEPTTTVPAFCRDISSAGIGLLHQIPLEPGRTFTLTIPLIRRELEIRCESNWCREVVEGQYFSGSAHHCVTTPQNLILLSVALSEKLNRRLHRRYPFVRPVTIDSPDGSSQQAFSRDVSQLGIGLIHREPIESGHFALSVHSATQGTVVATADIRRCTPIGEGWYSCGGRFPLEEIED